MTVFSKNLGGRPLWPSGYPMYVMVIAMID